MTETGKRYGTSLYELAAEEGLTERILAELDVAVNAMQEHGYLRLLMTPSVPKKSAVRCWIRRLRRRIRILSTS